MSHLTVSFLPSSIDSTDVPPVKEDKLLVPKDAVPLHTLKTSLAKQKMQSAQAQIKLTHFCDYHSAKNSEKGSYKRPQIILSPNTQLSKFFQCCTSERTITVGVVLSPGSQTCKSWLFYDCSLLSPCRGSRNTSLSEMGDVQEGILVEMYLIRQVSFLPPSSETENNPKDFYCRQYLLNEKHLNLYFIIVFYLGDSFERHCWQPVLSMQQLHNQGQKP